MHIQDYRWDLRLDVLLALLVPSCVPGEDSQEEHLARRSPAGGKSKALKGLDYPFKMFQETGTESQTQNCPRRQAQSAPDV